MMRTGFFRWTVLSFSTLSLLFMPINAEAAKKSGGGGGVDDPGCKACMSKAATLFGGSQDQQALELLQQWSAKCPRNAQLHLLYSTILMREGKNLAGAEREALLAVAARPDLQGTHLQAGMTLMSNGKYQQAAQEFKAVTDLNPASYEAWSALADLYKRLRDDPQAAEAANRAANLEPGTKSARLAVLNNLKRGGNAAKAKRELQRLLRDGGFGPEFDQSLAEEALQIGAYDEAIEAAARSSQAYPKSVQPLKSLATAQYLARQYGPVVETSNKLLAVSANNPDGLALKALSLFAQGKTKEAVAAAAQAEGADASGLSLVATGLARLQKGEYQQAVDSWKACAITGARATVNERLPETLAHLQLFRFFRKGGAIDDALTEARAINSDSRFKSVSAGAQALCLFEDGTRPEDAQPADKLLQEAAGGSDGAVEYLLAQAMAQLKGSNYELAKRSLEKASALEPGLADTVTLLARVSEAEGKLEEAMQIVQKGLEAAPADPGLMCVKGRLLVKSNKGDDAVKLLGPLTAEPACPTALMILAEVAEKKGANSDAVKYYRQSIEGLGPSTANVVRATVKRLEAGGK